MKTLHRYKKVFQNTFLSIICALFFVVSSAHPAKADIIKQGTVATNYGSYHWECFAGTTDSPISLGLNIIGVNLSFRSGSGFSFRYNFKDKYSGQITIGITTSNTWRYIDAYCTVNGGAFNSTPASSSSYLSSHTFTINFEQCEYLEFTVYLDGVGYANYFNSNTSISIAYGRTPTVDDKLTEIDTAIDLYLPGMSTNLSNISSNSSTIVNDLAVLLGYVDNVETLLNSINTNIGKGLPQVAFDVNLGKSSPYVPFNYTNNSFYNYSYNYKLATVGPVNRIDLRFNTNDIINGNYLLLMFPITMSSYSDPNLANMFIQYRNYNGQLTRISGAKYFWKYNQARASGVLSWYIPINEIGQPNTTYEYNFQIESFEFTNVNSVGFMFGGVVESLPYDDQYLSLLEQIATGIGNISQQQVIENNTNINNYNSYQTQINDVENNYYNQYNTYETSIENNNTFDFTGLDSTGVTAFNDVFTSMYNLPLIKWPVLITLLGLVIVIILG